MSRSKAMRSFLSAVIAASALAVGAMLLAGSLYPRQGQTAQAAPESARDAFAHFVPAAGAPQSGGSVQAGTKFTIDLYINAGSNQDPDGITAAQSYMTFNNSVLQVVDPGANCSATPPSSATFTTDAAQFEATLQNETCNGPQPCTLRGQLVNPGLMAFASGALSHCPHGCGGDFRVASITLCAVAGGHAEIAFQFLPGSTRDTEIVAYDDSQVHNPSLYHSYVINVNGPTATPGPPTWTPGPTQVAGCTMDFSDVASSNEFYSYIQLLYCRTPRVITGYADGTFRPYDATKRAQLAKMLVLTFNLPINTGGGPHFTDVPASNEAYQYIETVFNSHIVTGFANNLFKPWDQVKRGQVAKMVVGAANIAISTSGGPHFSDVATSNEFYQYIETARAHSMIAGFSDGTFKPYDNAKRGQIAKIISTAP